MLIKDAQLRICIFVSVLIYLKKGVTALIVAGHSGTLECLTILLLSGASPNLQSDVSV